MRRGCILPALLALTLAAQVAPAQRPEPSSLSPARYDLFWDKRDVNGLPLNPRWGTNIEARRLDPTAECGILGFRGPAGFRSVLLRDLSCFSEEQRKILRLTEPRRFVAGGAACGQAVDDGSPGGHLNWFPVTLTGTVKYGGSLKGAGGDFDFTFDMFTDRHPPATKYNHQARKLDSAGRRLSDSVFSTVHLEFDFRETTERMADTLSTWWRQFAKYSGTNRKSDRDAADRLLGLGRAIVTGLFNLDLVHFGHSEIHPVYAMAVLVRQTPKTGPDRLEQHYVFLARDRGNEGNCATGGSIPLRIGAPGEESNEYRFSLGSPDNVSGKPEVLTTESWVGSSTPGYAGTSFHWAEREGLEIRLKWPRPDSSKVDTVVLGEVTVSWPIGAVSAAGPAYVVDKTDKLMATGAIMEQSRQLRGTEPPPPVKEEPKGDETFVKGLLDFDAQYYATLLRIRTIQFDPTVTRHASLPPAAPIAMQPTEYFERMPPVIGCHQVSKSENPRCRGDWTIAPVLGMSFGGSGYVSGLSLENPRHYIGGPIVRLRYALHFVTRQFPVDTGGQSRLYSLSFQPTLVLGPVRKGITIYGLLSPGIGAERNCDQKWRAFFSGLAGVGFPLRSGWRVNLNAEVLYNARSREKGYWIGLLRIPIYPFI